MDISHPSDSLPKVRKGYYTHYKGGLYQVLGAARHSETLEQMVCYRSVPHGITWVRPLSEWLKPIDGSPDKPRFEPLPEETTQEEVFHLALKTVLSTMGKAEIEAAIKLQARMAAEQAAAPKEPDHMTGNCPKCSRQGHLHSFYATHVGYCHCCKVQWPIRHNLPPVWPETHEEWLEQALLCLSTRDYSETEEIPMEKSPDRISELTTEIAALRATIAAQEATIATFCGRPPAPGGQV